MNYETEIKKIDITVYISKYVIPVLEKKWIALITFLICLFVSLTMTQLIKPEYVTLSTLLIQQPRTKAVPKRTEDEVAPRFARAAYVGAMAERLKGNRIAIEVFKILPDKTKNDFKTSLSLSSQIISGLEKLLRTRLIKKDTDISERKMILMEMRERLTIKPNSRNSLISISLRTINKETGLIIIKAYIDVLIALNLEDNKKESKAKADFASEQRNKAYHVYTKAEKELLDFKKHYEIPGELEVARDVGLQLEMERLQANLEMAKTRFNFMDQVFLETRMKEAGIVGNISVIGSPEVSYGRSKKLRQRLLTYGIMVGLFLGIGVALLPEFIKGPIRHESDITSTVHLPVLGKIPKV